MKNLQGMLCFLEVASSGTLTAAAERLQITPAAVSKALAKLEQQLGVRLLNRSTRRLSLTAEGSLFLAKSKAALRSLDEAVAEVSQSAHTPAGRVRISVGMAFGRRRVLPLLPSLSQRYPQLSIDLDLDNRMVDLVASGIDIAIRGGVIDDSSLVARRVCSLPVALFASPAYLRHAGVPLTAEALSQHRCACLRLPDQRLSSWHFKAAGGQRTEFIPQAQLTSSDPENIVDLALLDAGIVQTGLHHALPHLRAGKLKLLLPGIHDPGSRQIVLHYSHRQYLAPRVRVVVDALLENFEQTRDLHLSVEDVVMQNPDVVAMPVQKLSPMRTARRQPKVDGRTDP